jgi:hypothetical protein
MCSKGLGCRMLDWNAMKKTKITQEKYKFKMIWSKHEVIGDCRCVLMCYIAQVCYQYLWQGPSWNKLIIWDSLFCNVKQNKLCILSNFLFGYNVSK